MSSVAQRRRRCHARDAAGGACAATATGSRHAPRTITPSPTHRNPAPSPDLTAARSKPMAHHRDRTADHGRRHRKSSIQRDSATKPPSPASSRRAGISRIDHCTHAHTAHRITRHVRIAWVPTLRARRVHATRCSVCHGKSRWIPTRQCGSIRIPTMPPRRRRTAGTRRSALLPRHYLGSPPPRLVRCPTRPPP